MSLDGRIALTVQDNGRGFDQTKIIGNLSAEGSKRGLGLTSMRERAELSGGSFAIESANNKGTTIQVLCPI